MNLVNLFFCQNKYLPNRYNLISIKLYVYQNDLFQQTKFNINKAFICCTNENAHFDGSRCVKNRDWY